MLSFVNSCLLLGCSLYYVTLNCFLRDLHEKSKMRFDSTWNDLRRCRVIQTPFGETGLLRDTDMTLLWFCTAAHFHLISNILNSFDGGKWCGLTPYAVAEQCVCVSLCVCGDERVYCTCYSYDLTQPRFSALCSDTRAPPLSSSSQSVTPPRFNKPCCSWFCCCYCCRGDANILVGINRDHKPKALFLLWEAGSGNKKKQFLKQERRMFDTKEQKLDQTQREGNSGFIIKTVESACFSLRCSSCALYCLWCSLTWTCLPFTCLVEPS